LPIPNIPPVSSLARVPAPAASLDCDVRGTKTAADERIGLQERTLCALVEEAMAATGVDDVNNRKIFTSTMLRRDPDDCLEVIMRFKSKCRAGKGTKRLSNPAAVLNHALSLLPVVS